MSTTNEIRERIFTNISDEVKEIDPTFNESVTEKNVTNAFSKAIAPEVKLIETFTRDAAKQGNPLEADSQDESDIGSLESWGLIKLNRTKDPATGGIYELTVTGNGTVPAGTQYVNQTTGFVYLVQTTVVITVSGTVTVASAGAGTEVDLEIGTELYSVQVIPGIDNPAIVATETQEPTAGETIEQYRDEILQSFRITPRGGARGDYVIWGSEVAGVRKVYPYSGPGLGDITQYVQETKTVSNPQGEASPAIITAVDDNARDQQPMSATLGLTTTSIIRRGYIITITNLSDVTKQTQIASIIDDYFDEKEPFLDGVDIENQRKDIISRAELMARVQNAILPATIDDLTMVVGVTPVITENLPPGEIPYRDNIIWA